ncbi:MAG: Periplasmic zinc-binding protein TroA [Chlamydiae bacterium]|nr:Periplasmic zinc-binding protein TroA [Chlamydiota bacterium]
MKQFVKYITLVCLAAVIATSCTNPKSKSRYSTASARKKVLCTISMVSDLVEHIAKDKLDVQTLIKKDLDPHSYELVKGDDEKLSQADLIFYNGLGLEHSPNISLHLKNHLNSHSVGDYIQKRYPQLILQTNNQVDPHIWMDVSILEKGVQLIVDQLSKLVPEESDFFYKNGLELQQKMKKTHFEILSLMQDIPEKRRYLITCHDAFYYFARGYLSQVDERSTESWKSRFIAPEGLAPDCQLSTTDIQRVILFLKENQVKTIFPEYNVNLDSLYKIKEASNKSGLCVEIASHPLYGDTMSKENTSDQNYLDMIVYNAQMIHQYLTQDENAHEPI